VSVDQDMEAGFLARFMATPPLLAAVPGGMWAGRIPAEMADDTARPMPYAQVKSDKGQDAEYYAAVETGDTYLDFRLVTVTIWGVGKAALGEVMRKAEAAYDWKIFPVPHSTLKSVQPLGPRTEEETAKRRGEDVWKGILQYRVTVQRTVL
jgi:hypothetical protein